MVRPGAAEPSIRTGAVMASAEFPSSAVSPAVVRLIVCPASAELNWIVSEAEPEYVSESALRTAARSEPGPESFPFATT